MTRRGEELRSHILFVAKDVFLELGFERASMDEVASRAQTSKRSLYAHFENKEKLFLAVVELVRGLCLERLKQPGDYSEKPAEALTAFCARYLEILVYGSSVRMCRLCIAEASRFPEGAERYFDVLFTAVHERVSTYLKSTLGTSTKASSDAAQRLLAQVIHPHYVRALFGLDTLAERLTDEPSASPVDVKPIRNAVQALLESSKPHTR
jgi:AcrR family transcriptional regulator